MTRDDIIRMAREAGFNQILATNAGEDAWIDDGFYVEELKNFAVLVAAAEREACAKVCFDMAQQHNDIRSAALEMASEYIRARGET
jgi:hypothetical protein